jgi:hypothetical protein
MVLLPHFTRAILGRTLLAWGFVRFIVALGKAAVEEAAELPRTHPLELVPAAALVVVLVITVAGWAYLRRYNQDLFLLCLGYDRAAIAAMLVGPLVVLELAVGIAVRL